MKIFKTVLSASLSCVVIMIFWSNSCFAETIGPKVGDGFSSAFTWDGRELKPRRQATFDNTLIFDGKRLYKKSGASFETSHIWDGKTIRPQANSTFEKTLVWHGLQLSRMRGSDFHNTWVVQGKE